MKKILLALVLGLLLSNTNAFAEKIGRGEIKLSPNTIKMFIRYTKLRGQKYPYKFVVSKSGNNAYWWYCPNGFKCSGVPLEKKCEKLGGEECFVFAEKRRIVWKNNNNFSVKERIINSKWSEQKINEKLTQLGFVTDVKAEAKKKVFTEVANARKIPNSLKVEYSYTSGVFFCKAEKRFNRTIPSIVISKKTVLSGIFIPPSACSLISQKEYIKDKINWVIDDTPSARTANDKERQLFFVENEISRFNKLGLNISLLKSEIKQSSLNNNLIVRNFINKSEKSIQVAQKSNKDKTLLSTNKKKNIFKPTISKQDKTPPEIIVSERMTVNDSTFIVKGMVKDQGSKDIYVQVADRLIPVKNGKFEFSQFSPVNKKIKIVATDQWGNKSEKVVQVIVDIKEMIVEKKFDSLNPSKARGRKSGNTVALIIGIEKYKGTSKASFASADAKFFSEYARRAFGVKKSNIKLMVDQDASLVQTLTVLSKWLPSKIKNGQTKLLVFFAGHGLASNDGNDLYLLSHDSDVDLLQRTALSRKELFKEIVKHNPKSVTMFLDTCYSGISRDEQTLLASARPIRIVAKESEDTPDNFAIFSASGLNEISSGLKEAKHGMFSYYLMKGLEGNADSNRDRKITNGEMLSYLQSNVSQQALSLGRNQNPSLAGNESNILLRY